MLEALFGPVENRLDEDRAILNDLEQLLTSLLGKDGVSDELKFRFIGRRHDLVLLTT